MVTSTADPHPDGGFTYTALPPQYRAIAMTVVLLGTFMVILDTSIVNVALPKIGADFGSISDVEWIVTAYLLAVGVSMTTTGWLADRFGKKRVFVVSLALFTLGSLLCALAPTLGLLVVWRVVQGLGGGALMPLGMAMIYELFPPHERGRALGIWGVAAMAAPSIGPVLGGYLSSDVSWRWLFVINIPIGVVAVPLASRLLRDVGYRDHRRLDVWGLVSAATGLVLVLLALSEAATWGWASPAFLTTTCVGVALLVAFVVHAARVRQPLIELRILRIPVFTLTLLVIWLVTIGQFARLVFIPLEFETLRGLSALDVGLLLTPSALGVAAMMPIGGRLADRVGARLPCVIGLAIVAVSFWPLAHLSAATPLAIVAMWLFVGGLGVGLAMMPNTVTGMNSVPGRYVAQASAIRSLNRQIAGAFGTAILASLLTAQIGTLGTRAVQATPHLVAGYNLLFSIAMWSIVAALLCALLLPGKAASLELQEQRRREEALAGDDTADADRQWELMD